MIRTRPIKINVHPNFFENIFEKERRKLQKQFGVNNLSQVQFTSFLAKNNASFLMKPKQAPNNAKTIKKYYKTKERGYY